MATRVECLNRGAYEGVCRSARGRVSGGGGGRRAAAAPRPRQRQRQARRCCLVPGGRAPARAGGGCVEALQHDKADEEGFGDEGQHDMAAAWKREGALRRDALLGEVAAGSADEYGVMRRCPGVGALRRPADPLQL